MSYVLRLEPSQLRALDSAPRGEGEGLTVLVDDCALSGARLARAIERVPGPLGVALLASHASLRAAVEDREPRVGWCVAALDLPLRGEPWPSETDSRWRARLPGPRYWLGPVESVVFPWSEPEKVWWNERDQRLETEWRRSSPWTTLRSRVELDLPPERSGPGGIDLADGVLWKLDGERVLLRREDGTGSLLGLEGVAFDMWRLLIGRGDRERALEELLALYDVERSQLARDLDRFLAELLDRGLLEETPVLGS